nr:transmembrane CLPTM1 family protein [Tanacetum cinerariifolium]
MPWRQMTYKFLNIIIDDLFAFVIKKPMLHRLSLFHDEVCEEEKPETVKYETSAPITALSKDKDQEHDQAVNMLEKDKGEDDFASAQNATPVDVCISAPITLEEESKEKEKKNSEEVVKSDDSQTKKLKSLVDKETCKEIMSKEDIKDEYQENEKEIDISLAYSEEGHGLSATPTQMPKEERDGKSIDV